MPRGFHTLLTECGDFALHEVESLGNQCAVIDKRSIYVVSTGNRRLNESIALAALGAGLDVGLLAWPKLSGNDDDY